MVSMRRRGRRGRKSCPLKCSIEEILEEILLW
jgi:hypothetical protein